MRYMVFNRSIYVTTYGKKAQPYLHPQLNGQNTPNLYLVPLSLKF